MKIKSLLPIFIIVLLLFFLNAEATPYSNPPSPLQYDGYNVILNSENIYDPPTEWWNQEIDPSLDHTVINEIYPLTLENTNEVYTLSGLNFESTSTDDTWSYTENSETIGFIYDKMQWDTAKLIVPTSSHLIPITSTSSITYPDALNDGISIKIIQDNYQWQKIVEIESLASLGDIPTDAEYLEISFLITGDIALPDGLITEPIPITTNSFIQPVRAWDDNNVDIRGVLGTVSDNIVTKRIPVLQLRSASYPIQTDLTITFGSEAVYNSAETHYIDVAALDNTHFVTVYRDTGNSGHGTARVGSVSGTTITYGAESVFNAGSTQYTSVAKISSTSFIVVFQDVADTDDATAMIGTVSGTTITGYGAESDFHTSAINTKVDVLDSTHFVVLYSDVALGHSKIGVFSGSTITSYGSEVFFTTDDTRGFSLAALDSTHFVVAFTDNSNSYYGTGIVGTVSGTGITYGAENVFFSGAVDNGREAKIAALNSTHFVVVYSDTTDYTQGVARVGLVSGNTISSYGAASEYFTISSTEDVAVTALDSTHFVGLTASLFSNYACGIVGTVSGTTISSYGPYNVFDSTATQAIAASALDSSHFVVSYTEAYTNIGSAIAGLAEVPASSYIPPNPTSLANTTGTDWINHTWSAGSGNVTDSFNVSINSVWTNGSSATFYNGTSYSLYEWQNITVYAYNSSASGTLSTSSTSQNTQIENIGEGSPDAYVAEISSGQNTALLSTDTSFENTLPGSTDNIADTFNLTNSGNLNATVEAVFTTYNGTLYGFDSSLGAIGGANFSLALTGQTLIPLLNTDTGVSMTNCNVIADNAPKIWKAQISIPSGQGAATYTGTIELTFGDA